MNRLSRVAAVGFAFLCGLGLAGCVQEEKKVPSEPVTEKKAAPVEDCPSCCTPLSRSALLARGRKKDATEVASEAKDKE